MSSESSSATEPEHRTKNSLGLWDAVSIIVGIVVGTTIFKSPAMVFQSVSGPYQAIAAWLLGGALSFAGALCYAELATSYPRSGGDYQYLSRAFGPCVGFLFGWAQLCVVLTGSIGAMAYAFADYFQQVFAVPVSNACLAVSAVAILSAANLLGIAFGKSTQNLLSGIKVLGIVAIIAAGLAFGGRPELTTNSTVPTFGFGLAMVFVLYAYGGWNDAAFVAAEVRDASRNIPWALFLSIGGITLLYVLVNGAYLLVLGFDRARVSWTPATDVIAHVAGPGAAKIVSVLVMICALSAINGLILTGSRIFSSLGEDHRLFRLLRVRSLGCGTPTRSILAQCFVTVGLIMIVGTSRGQHILDSCLTFCLLQPLPWESYFGGFETLVAGTAPVFWAFFLLTGISQFVLRYRDRELQRPFLTPWYPIPPIIFCATSIFMLYSSVSYAKSLCLVGVVPVAFGLPLYWISQTRLKLRDVWSAANQVQPVARPQ